MQLCEIPIGDPVIITTEANTIVKLAWPTNDNNLLGISMTKKGMYQNHLKIKIFFFGISYKLFLRIFLYILRITNFLFEFPNLNFCITFPNFPECLYNFPKTCTNL